METDNKRVRTLRMDGGKHGVTCVNLPVEKTVLGIWDYKLTKLHEYLKKLVLWDGFEEKYGSGKGWRARHRMSNGY